jgi:hypothetical protein
MRDEHPSAAESVDTEFVEYLLWVFVILARARLEFLPVLTDDLSTRETPDWYHHG